MNETQTIDKDDGLTDLFGAYMAAQIWCDPRVSDVVMDDVLAQVIAEKFNNLVDSIELAWGIIANSYGGDWDLASPEWKRAAENWRDNKWHKLLNDYTENDDVVE